jgi:hypothetical protein
MLSADPEKMTAHRFVAVALSAVLVFLAPAAGPVRADRQPSGTEPKLVVIIAVDQMRADYLTRYGVPWQGGLKRLMTDGAWFTEAAYPYQNTITCAGHATIGSGRFPYHTGVILNAWFDRESGKSMECTYDPSASTVAAKGRADRGDSARELVGPALGDAIKDARGNVVTISMKARAAIMLAGHHPTASVWYVGNGNFATSTAFAGQVPQFVVRTLDDDPVDKDRSAGWTKVLPDNDYQGPDEGLGERAPAGWTTTFPHTFTDRFYDQWQQSPLADAYLERLAEAAIDQYKLGRGDHVDYLGVSFSALDSVGHGFGPDSHEVQDTLARLDRTLEKLLNRLDDRVGKGKYVLALSADHGVAPIPEQAKARGEDAGRITTGAIVKDVDAALVPFLGPPPHVRAVAYTDFYFRPASWDKLQKNQPALKAAIDAIQKYPGIERVLVSTDLLEIDPKDPVQRAAATSYYKGRSGDLILVPKKYWIFAADGTTHGTAHDYDQRVPLIFYGAGVAAGRRTDPSSPADIAVTLARFAHVTLEGDGHALDVSAAVGGSSRQ